MAENSGIAWTTHTHNEWEGCTKVGPGCDGCYAAARNERFHGGINWGAGAPRRLTSIQNRNRPFRWQRERRAAIDSGENPPPIRVFGGSLMDPFDNEVPQEWRDALWAKVRLTPDLEWIFVTKRVGNVAKMVSPDWKNRPVVGLPSNVILLATIVNQEEADRDMPKLVALKTVGVVSSIGVSYEPALGPVDWSRWLPKPGGPIRDAAGGTMDIMDDEPGIDWLIVGGESDQGQHKARPFDVQWARDAIRQARGTGCAVFIKQLGSNPVAHFSAQATQELQSFSGRDPNRPEKFALTDKAGADPEEWPADLRVREFPVIGGAS